MLSLYLYFLVPHISKAKIKCIYRAQSKRKIIQTYPHASLFLISFNQMIIFGYIGLMVEDAVLWLLRLPVRFRYVAHNIFLSLLPKCYDYTRMIILYFKKSGHRYITFTLFLILLFVCDEWYNDSRDYGYVVLWCARHFAQSN